MEGWGGGGAGMIFVCEEERKHSVSMARLGCSRQCNFLSWLLNSVSVYLHEPMSPESENNATTLTVCRLVNKLRGQKNK